MKQQFIDILFSHQEGRAFTPVVNEDGAAFQADMRIKQCKRFGRVDLRHEADPRTFLNIALIRDATEKLLGCFIVYDCLRTDMPDDIMEYVLDEDYGLLIAVDDNKELQTAIFIDIYSKLSAPYRAIYQKYQDFEHMVNTLVHEGFTFTDYDKPGGGGKPDLRLI